MADSNIVLYDKRNPLTRRRELQIRIGISSKQPTPSRKQLKEEVARLLNVDSAQLVIVSVNQDYGTNFIKVTAHVYDAADYAHKFERSYLLDRDQGIKKSKGSGSSGEQVTATQKNS
jgi:small subunit ribosomal protein S24e